MSLEYLGGEIILEETRLKTRRDSLAGRESETSECKSVHILQQPGMLIGLLLETSKQLAKQKRMVGRGGCVGVDRGGMRCRSRKCAPTCS